MIQLLWLYIWFKKYVVDKVFFDNLVSEVDKRDGVEVSFNVTFVGNW